MKIETELRIRLLLECMRTENEIAHSEITTGDGWLCDHASANWERSREIEELLKEEK